MSIADLASTLVPKDRGVRRVAQGLSYGPHAKHQLDVYAPLAGGPGPLPVIVFFYGGGWTDGARRHYGFAAHALASLGYVVVVPDYRLVPEIEYPAFVEDCALSIGWVHAAIGRHRGDPERLVLMGHSAGAYNAASLALDRRWIGDAEVQKAIRGVIGLSGPYDFHPFDGPISQRVFGAAEDQPATQPIRHVSKGAPPMLLVSGGRDGLVLPRNSLNLAAAIEAAGGHARLRIHRHLRHAGTLFALSVPLRWLAPIRRECADFLKEVTGPQRADF